MAPWMKMTWHRRLGEQTESLATPGRFGKALCTEQASEPDEMPTPLLGRVMARPGRRRDTSGVDRGSHVSTEHGAPGRQVHKKLPHWLGNATACFPSPTSFRTTIMCCVRGKRYGFSDRDAPLKAGGIRADVKHASVDVCIGETSPSLQLNHETPWGELTDKKS